MMMPKKFLLIIILLFFSSNLYAATFYIGISSYSVSLKRLSSHPSHSSDNEPVPMYTNGMVIGIKSEKNYIYESGWNYNFFSDYSTYENSYSSSTSALTFTSGSYSYSTFITEGKNKITTLLTTFGLYYNFFKGSLFTINLGMYTGYGYFTVESSYYSYKSESMKKIDERVFSRELIGYRMDFDFGEKIILRLSSYQVDINEEWRLEESSIAIILNFKILE